MATGGAGILGAARSLRPPRLRPGSDSPAFLEARRSSENALPAVVPKPYVQGSSTRYVNDLVKALRTTGIAESKVSRLCEEGDEWVGAFLPRPLNGDWLYLCIDPTYVNVRQAGRIVSVLTKVVSAAVIATEFQPN